MRRCVLVTAVAALVIAGCGGTSSSDDALPDSTAVESTADGLATVSPDAAAAVIDAEPDGLVVLDVRTPEEFADGHLDGAVLVDFYDADFAAQLAELDPTVPYVVYCRSGNRSGQTLTIMDELGFESAVDVDGGIIAWADAGFPVVVD